MKSFIRLSLVLLMLCMASVSFACKNYKKTEGYNYLKNKQVEAIEYKNNLPEEEKIDISNDVTQVNSERKKLFNKYSDIFEMKFNSKRYINRQKDEFDSFEEMSPSEEDNTTKSKSL